MRKGKLREINNAILGLSHINEISFVKITFLAENSVLKEWYTGQAGRGVSERRGLEYSIVLQGLQRERFIHSLIKSLLHTGHSAEH